LIYIKFVSQNLGGATEDIQEVGLLTHGL